MGTLESGHIGINWNYDLASNKVGTVKGPGFKRNKYNFKTGNYDGMRAYFMELNWEVLLKNESVQVQYDIFLEYYNIACDKFLKKRRSDQNIKIRPKWMEMKQKQL